MASRPWVTPEEVKAYSEYKTVKNRDNNKLSIDISRAEQYVIKITNNSFENKEIPVGVKTAVILVAEAYAFNATLAADRKKSEQFDDYSYTMDDSKPIDIPSLDLSALLEEYSIEKPRNSVFMRMRKL